MNKKKKTIISHSETTSSEFEENIYVPTENPDTKSNDKIPKVIEQPIDTVIWEGTKVFEEWKKIRDYYRENEKIIEEAERFLSGSEILMNEIHYLETITDTDILNNMSHINRKKHLFNEMKKSVDNVSELKTKLIQFAEDFDGMTTSFRKKHKDWIDDVSNNKILIKANNIWIDKLNSKELLEFIIDIKLISDTAKLFNLLHDLQKQINSLSELILNKEKW